MTSVFAAGPKFELLAENAMNEYTLSSVAVSDGQIFLRTEGTSVRDREGELATTVS